MLANFVICCELHVREGVHFDPYLLPVIITATRRYCLDFPPRDTEETLGAACLIAESQTSVSLERGNGSPMQTLKSCVGFCPLSFCQPPTIPEMRIRARQQQLTQRLYGTMPSNLTLRCLICRQFPRVCTL